MIKELKEKISYDLFTENIVKRVFSCYNVSGPDTFMYMCKYKFIHCTYKAMELPVRTLHTTDHPSLKYADSSTVSLHKTSGNILIVYLEEEN